MFCGQCGKALPDNAVVCPCCGRQTGIGMHPSVAESEKTIAVPVPDMDETVAVNVAPPAESQGMPMEEPGSYMPSQEGMPRRKINWKKVLCVSAPCIVLALLIGFFGVYIENFFVKLFTSPDGYFRWVVKNNMAEMLDGAANGYDDLLDMISMNQGDNHMELSVELSSQMQTLLKEATGQEFSKLDKVSINLDTFANKKQISAMAGLLINDEKNELLNIEGAYNKKDQQLVATVPGLTEEWVGFSIPSRYADVLGIALNTDFSKVLPKGTTVKNMLLDYLGKALKEVEGVKQTSGSFDANGVVQKGTTLTVELTQEDLNDISSAYLKAMREDKKLKKVVTKTTENIHDLEIDWDDLGVDDFPDSDEVYNALIDWLDEAIDDLDDSIADERVVTVRLYVDGGGHIYGSEITEEWQYTDYNGAPQMYKTTTVYGITHKGSDVGIVMESYGEYNGQSKNVFCIKGSGEVSLLGNLNGELLVTNGDTDLAEVEFTKCKVTGKYLDGTVTVRLLNTGVSELDNSEIVISLDSSKKKLELSASFIQDGDPLITIGLLNKIGKGEKVKLPNEEDVTTVETETELLEYLNSVDLNELMNRLDGIGFGSVADWIALFK